MNLSIPAGLSAEDAQRALLDLAERRATEKAKADEQQAVLESDDAFNSWCRTHMGHSMFARASVYGSRQIAMRQEILCFVHDRNPSRPVLMRGSCEFLIWSRSNAYYGNDCANGWCDDVLERYLRVQKFTSFDREETMQVVNNIVRRLSRRHYTTYHFNGYRHYLSWPGVVYINGKRRHLKPEQAEYLGRLHEIVKKTRELERVTGQLSRKAA